MAGFAEGVDRGQTVLFADRLEDWTGEDSVVRVVDLFVDDPICQALGLSDQRLREWVDRISSGGFAQVIHS